MLKVTKIQSITQNKARVCAYVRVSTDSEAQEDSFIFQSKYWHERFSNDSEVEFVGVFSDEGISGKLMQNRKGLNDMLKKVRNGEIDIVYTKSISRFARNFIELMTVVRELRDKSIPIIFDKENLNTLDPKSGLVLSVMASLAEEELRSMSENQKWAARKRFANGIFSVSRMYGYKYNKGKITINEKEAEGVRLIYKLYLNGYGVDKIVNIMNDTEFRPNMGGEKWHRGSIMSILNNEKTTGNALLQKSIYNLNVRKRNKGELPQYYIEENHEGIIAKEEFEEVQRIRKERSQKYCINCVGKNSYPLSHKIKCGNCGSTYRRKTFAKGKSYENIKWSCITKDQKTKDACDNHETKDEVITKLLIEAFNECLDNSSNVCLKAKQENDQLQDLLKTEQELKQLRIKGYISEEQHKRELEKLLAKIKEHEYKIKLANRNTNFNKLKKSATFTQDMADFLIQAVIKDWTITFKFENGYETTKQYTNGRAGNVNGKLCKH